MAHRLRRALFQLRRHRRLGQPRRLRPNGAVLGLGWKDIVSVHTGVQYFATDRLALRMGYQFNQNPISTDVAFFNVASPLILEHVLGIGCSYRLTEHEIISLAYLHGFQNESTGPIQLPGIGVIPGSRSLAVYPPMRWPRD